MTLRHLRIFIEVAETRKMSLAAQNLYLSQPTVSQAISELEDHYGTLLFERLNRRLFITPAGEKLLACARDVILRYARLEDTMGEYRRSGSLRIGASLTVGTCLMPEVVEDLHAALPQLSVSTHINNTARIEEMLIASELDAACVEGEIHSHDLLCEPVVDDELVLVCAAQHPFWGERELHFSQLSGQRFALRERGSGTRALFEKSLARHGIAPAEGWEAIGTETLLRAVEQDCCLCVIAFSLVRPLLESGRLYMFKNTSGEWTRQFKLVRHKDKFESAFLLAFTDAVRRHAPAQEQPGFSYGLLVE